LGCGLKCFTQREEGFKKALGYPKKRIYPNGVGFGREEGGLPIGGGLTTDFLRGEEV